MARDTDALKVPKWAATGDVEDPASGSLPYAGGWTSTYSTSGGALPKREHFNWLFRVLGALGVEINTHGGVLEWDSTIAYDHPALVMGSNNVVYKSVRDSTNRNPTTDTGDDWLVLVPAAAAAPDASTSTRGLVELATTTEASTGTDTLRAVTPAGLAGALPSAAPDASTSTRGLVELATTGEASSGTDSARAVTPAGLSNGNVDRVDGKHIWTGTEAEYDAIASPDANTVYVQIP